MNWARGRERTCFLRTSSRHSGRMRLQHRLGLVAVLGVITCFDAFLTTAASDIPLEGEYWSPLFTDFFVNMWHYNTIHAILSYEAALKTCWINLKWIMSACFFRFMCQGHVRIFRGCLSWAATQYLISHFRLNLLIFETPQYILYYSMTE